MTTKELIERMRVVGLELSRQAAQENCDGEPYDVMQEASEVMRQIVARYYTTTDPDQPDIIERLDHALKGLKNVLYPDGLFCHCDPSVGSYPCDICGEKELLRNARGEILLLRAGEERKELGI